MTFTDATPRTRPRRTALTVGALSAGLFASLMAPTVAMAAEAPSYTEQKLAVAGDNAISASLAPTYRIPALADLGDGIILASYDGRPNGGDSPAPNSIIQRRSTDGGLTWGAATFVARGQIGSGGNLQYGFSDPSYVVDKETGNVFNFHVYSKNQGFWGSVIGVDDSNRNVTSTQVSVSTDKGLTWSTDPINRPSLPVPTNYAAGSAFSAFDGPLVTDVAKPVGTTVNGVANVGGVVGMFATSGEGIQIQHGQYQGRLVQQFAGRVRTAAGTEVIQAYSLFSDDHGATWQRGAFVGTGMDENKVVELSNGNLMLNSRDGANGKGRKVATSTDGGASWGPISYNTTLADPTNNASIVRMYPNATPGSAESKILLFSNANSTTSRANGSIRYSCDDGTTWSAGKQFKSGYMAYSSLTALSDGQFGMLYESDGNAITFAKFNAAWLGVFCGATLSAPTISGANGATVQAQLIVTNTSNAPLNGATAGFQAKAGWTFGSVAVPSLAAGATATVSVPVTIPAFAKAGTESVTGVVSVNGQSVQQALPVTVTGGATSNIVGLSISGVATDTTRNLSSNPYTVGQAVPYKFTVTSLSNVSASSVPTAGNFKPFVPADGAGNCRYLTLAVGASYDCTTAKHIVTAADLALGYFVPQTTWQVTGAGAATQNYTITGDRVPLKAP